MKQFCLIAFSFLFFITAVQAQVQVQVQSDSTSIDSLAVVDTKKLITDIPKPERPFIVSPWLETKSPDSQIITTDSLLRWQVWAGWGDFQAYRRDVVSFRLGTAASPDAFHIKGFMPYEQELFVEGLDMKNPVTGFINYNYVPQRKIAYATESLSGNYTTRVNLKDYYIVKPVSYLNYDESSFEYRNLEFMISRNITDRTNLELSYWDRRDGGYFRNNSAVGSQIFGRLYHHLSNRFLLRILFMQNKFERNEPFGYMISDPLTFSFDQFSSIPLSSNGASSFKRRDLISGIYHRRDSSSAEDAGLEFSISSNFKKIASANDTTAWDIRTLNGRLFKKLDLQVLKFNAELNAETNQVKGFSSINISDWFNLSAQAGSGIYAGPFNFYANGSYYLRSDEKTGYSAVTGIKSSYGNSFFNINASYFDRMPSIQAMYWNSQHYGGDANLRNELGYSYTATADLKIFDRFTLGGNWRYKNAKRSVFLSTDSTFINSNVYEQYTAGVYLRFESNIIELESSAIGQRTDYCCSTNSFSLNNVDELLWLRNSAFVKGYVFDRAAYLKIGIKTLFSPLSYSSRTFNTELQYWQGGSNYTELPPFFRLDAELSARVRAIMIVLRWENLLDGVGQAGYFETAGFPMPPRRLIIGIRAQFRN